MSRKKKKWVGKHNTPIYEASNHKTTIKNRFIPCQVAAEMYLYGGVIEYIISETWDSKPKQILQAKKTHLHYSC